jgi:hypothetical protein
MMLRGLEDGILRGEEKVFEEGRTPGVGKRFGVTKDFLVETVRYELSDVRRVERGSHFRPLVMQRAHDGSCHSISTWRS